jgi:hypothetical protein
VLLQGGLEFTVHFAVSDQRAQDDPGIAMCRKRYGMRVYRRLRRVWGKGMCRNHIAPRIISLSPARPFLGARSAPA